MLPDCATIEHVKSPARKRLHQDRPASHTAPRQLLQLLEEHIPGFRDDKYAFQIAWLLWCTIDPERAHRAYEGAAWMHTDDIRRLFSEVKNFRNANREPAMRYFNVLRHQNSAESPEDAYTNGYLPRPWMQKALDLVIQSGAPLDFVDQRRRSRAVHSRAICSTDVHGSVVRRWKGVNVPTLIPVIVENLHVLLRRWEYLIESRQQPEMLAKLLERYDLNEAALDRARRQTQTLFAEAKGSRHPGMLPIRYVLHASGRLYAEGLNLQSCKREIRQAALAGHWDVDISTCHFAIMAQMAKKFGVSCPSIEDYAARKRDYRAQIARDIGVSLRQSKKLINAVGYGAPRSTSPYTEIPKQIGRDKAEAFFAHPLYRGLKADVDAATRIILAKHPVKNNKLNNLANRGIALKTEEGQSTKESALIAHLLQGVEAAALEAAVRACDAKVLLLQHDGFTAAGPVDAGMLNRAVQVATGYDLIFEVEQIEMPFADITPAQSFNKKLNDPRKPNIHEGLQPFWPCKSGTVAFSPDDVPPVFPLPLPTSDPAF